MTDRIDAATGEVLIVGPPKASPTIGQLVEALAKAQREIEVAPKDATNPHLNAKYADLPAVWKACRPALTKYGLAVIQRPGLVTTDQAEALIVVSTLLAHTSGEWIESHTVLRPVPDKAGHVTPQSIGSAITYGRRYGLAAMVGVVADTDDDAQGASAPGPRAAPSSPRRPVEAPAPAENGAARPKATPAEIGRLMGARDRCGLSREKADILRELSAFTQRPITSRSDLTPDEVARYVSGLEELLAREAGGGQ